MKKVTIYTNGTCLENPGPGGWGAILLYENYKKELSGGIANTTNNITELTAVIESLKILTEPCEVNLYSNSGYVVYAFSQGWLSKWIKNGWRTSNKKSVKNKEIWKQLFNLTERHKVNFFKTTRCKFNEFTNRCDELSVNAIKNL